MNKLDKHQWYQAGGVNDTAPMICSRCGVPRVASIMYQPCPPWADQKEEVFESFLKELKEIIPGYGSSWPLLLDLKGAEKIFHKIYLLIQKYDR